MSEIVSYDTNPTIERPLSFTLEEAFDFFNQRLWEGALPPVILLLHRPRSERTGGHYSPRRWRSRTDITLEVSETQLLQRNEDLWKQNEKRSEKLFGDPNGWDRGEIALNPEAWVRQTDKHILSILVHEMCHHWQSSFGKEPRGGYHNRQWGTEMKRVGLYPSNTGEPGGKETGQQMTHYILPGELFDTACDELLAGGMKLDWESPKPRKLKPPPSKIKYTCDPCDVNAWAKPNTRLLCGTCKAEMKSEEDDE